MFGSEILEVAIGVIFVFLLIAIICAAVREGIEARLKSRAAHLEYAIRELLHDREGVGLAHSFYNHPLIFGLYSGEYPGALTIGAPTGFTRGGDLPSYIPTRNFAVTLVDLVVRGPETDAVSGDPRAPAISPATIRAAIPNLQNPPVQRMLLTALDTAQDDLDTFYGILEQWYNSAMDRVSGMYKRSTQGVIFGIGVIVALALNVDAIAMSEYLYRNDAAREVVVASAEAAADDPQFTQVGSAVAQQELAALRLPIGWSNTVFAMPGTEREVIRILEGQPRRVTVERGWWDYVFSPLMGWLITALAATLGAPFWFDVLNKVMVVRSTVKPHEKSPEEASEDRQLRARRGSRTFPGATPEEVGAGTDRRPSGGEGAEIGQPLTRDGAGAAAAAIHTPRDLESDVDGCDLDFDDPTPDWELPPARGGVATS